MFQYAGCVLVLSDIHFHGLMWLVDQLKHWIGATGGQRTEVCRTELTYMQWACRKYIKPLDKLRLRKGQWCGFDGSMKVQQQHDLSSMEASYSDGTAPSCVFLSAAAGTQHQHLMVSAQGGRTFGSGTTAPSMPCLRLYLAICCGPRRGGKEISWV